MAVAECSFMMYQAHILCLLDLAVQQPKVKLHQSQLLCGGQIENM